MQKNTFFLFIFILTLESCNLLYVPASPAVPVFENNQPLVIGGSIGAKGWNANADYSPLNHFYFGASYHGLETGGLNSHESLGGHIGYYYNQPGFSGSSNFQLGYTKGRSDYGDPFSGNENYVHEGRNSYQEIYLQAFQSLKTHKENTWIFGARFEMYHAHYSRIWPGVYRDELPVHTAFPMVFICYQYAIKSVPGLYTDFYVAGFASTIPAGLQARYAFYSNPVLRIGVSYRFQFGKNKTEEQKK